MLNESLNSYITLGSALKSAQTGIVLLWKWILSLVSEPWKNVIISAWATERHWCFDGAWDLSLWCVGFPPWLISVVIGPFHSGFDHGQLWAQAPRGHLPSDLCDRRKENNSQESRQLVPAVSFPASGTTEQEKVSYCETTHHRSGGLWQVQVRSCVSINISWCFSPESG